MSFEITGQLHKKFETESKTATFQSREFVIYTPAEQYPQYIKFQLTQSRTSLIDPFEEGTEIKVTFDLSGREWQGKYFTNLNAWRVEAAGGLDQSTSSPSAIPSNNDIPFEINENFDDMPF